MVNWVRLSACLVTWTIVMASPVWAQSNDRDDDRESRFSGFYIGGGYGSADYDISETDEAGQVFIGFRQTLGNGLNLGIEGSANIVGEFALRNGLFFGPDGPFDSLQDALDQGTAFSEFTSADTTGFLLAKVGYELSDGAMIYGGAGIASSDSLLDEGNFNTGFGYEAGLELMPTGWLGLRGSFKGASIGEGADSTSIMVSVFFSF